MDRKTNERLNLDRLRARIGEKPRTKAGQIRQAWPEIRALFAAGHSLKDIWIWLNEIGIEIGYARLSHYAGQLKRRDQTAAPPFGGRVVEAAGERTDIPVLVQGRDGERRTEPTARDETTSDPLSHIRSREEHRTGFLHNAEPDAKKLI